MNSPGARAAVLHLTPAQTAHYRDLSELAGWVDQLQVIGREGRNAAAQYREGYEAALDVVRFEIADRLATIEKEN